MDTSTVWAAFALVVLAGVLLAAGWVLRGLMDRPRQAADLRHVSDDLPAAVLVKVAMIGAPAA